MISIEKSVKESICRLNYTKRIQLPLTIKPVLNCLRQSELYTILQYKSLVNICEHHINYLLNITKSFYNGIQIAENLFIPSMAQHFFMSLFTQQRFYLLQNNDSTIIHQANLIRATKHQFNGSVTKNRNGDYDCDVD